MAREETWKGLTTEQAKSLSNENFLSLISARARRSLKRGTSPDQQVLLKQLDQGKDRIKTHVRDMVITPQMLGKTLLVYNGKEFKQVIITLEMLGHFIGEFALTRKSVSHSAAGVGATRSSKAISAR